VGAVVIVIALVLKVVWFDVASVGHNGMAPTLIRGERVLINKRGEPKLGSIAVCQHPTEVGWVVGRVAATEGMTIDSFGSELRIDGEPVRFDRQGVTTFHNLDNDRRRSLVWGTEHLGPSEHLIFMEDGGRHLVNRTEVQKGKLYLLGDFRAYMGQDSRAYGVVDASTCRGTIVFRITPKDGLDRDIAHRYFQPIQ
jgi:signal peptidase I